MKVPGIGPKTFDGFRELITAGGDGARPMPQSQATKASTGPETSLNAPVTTYPSTGETGLIININTATQADFESLPGIGPAIAEKIIQYRQAHGPFQSTRDLRKVSGIGEKKLEKLEPCIRVE
ncbi:ComEA family DNA-binding protein [Candidatus Sumerlaeota bacterium]|nr:ComEA family DNA-binding protein [Candidatus Sumerlaeota bacterium]